eukprot:PhF_6_TR32164/c0_g1_i1/m.47713
MWPRVPWKFSAEIRPRYANRCLEVIAVFAGVLLLKHLAWYEKLNFESKQTWHHRFSCLTSSLTAKIMTFIRTLPCTQGHNIMTRNLLALSSWRLISWRQDGEVQNQ